jgi:LytS/YehU family sensor histidine kinase
VRVLAGLGDLLRRMLDQAAVQEVPLKHEVDFIRSYLEIEQVRFRDRLRVTIHVAPDTLDAAVPYLILQPLVENAIRHGIAPHVAGGTVLIGARRLNGRLVLTVRDDGLGIPDARGPSPRVGLANTRARLERLYGRDYELTVENAAEGGVEARMELPLRLAHAEWSPEE